jgi:hypothetical protein
MPGSGKTTAVGLLRTELSKLGRNGPPVLSVNDVLLLGPCARRWPASGKALTQLTEKKRQSYGRWLAPRLQVRLRWLGSNPDNWSRAGANVFESGFHLTAGAVSSMQATGVLLLCDEGPLQAEVAQKTNLSHCRTTAINATVSDRPSLSIHVSCPIAVAKQRLDRRGWPSRLQTLSASDRLRALHAYDQSAKELAARLQETGGVVLELRVTTQSMMMLRQDIVGLSRDVRAELGRSI